MSQVSYGTITIVDTTDIARIYMVYAKSVSNTTPPSDELTWSESIASAPGEGDFIWQKTVVEKAITEEKTYSDPMCVTGSSGQGVEKIINYYCNYGQGQPEEDYSGWQLEIPEYDTNKPNYWTKVVVIYSDDTREDFQASGTIATFESEKIGTLDSLEVSLSPIQSGSGTPSPDNIRPISGWDEVETVVSGKNIFGGRAFADGIKTAIPQAVLDTDAKTISYASVYATSTSNFTSGVRFKENTQYTIILKFSNTVDRTNMLVAYTDGTSTIIRTSGTGLQTIIFTSVTNKTINYIGGSYNNGTSVFYYEECGVFEGVITADQFEPYTATTYTTDLPQTVYGGTLDVVNGTLTVDRAIVDLGPLNWAKYNTQFYANIPNAKIPSYGVAANAICSNYPMVAMNALADKTIAINDGQSRVNAMDSSYADAAAFKTAMNGVQLVYELATPTSYSLTPQEVQTLLGSNNVWSDGTVELRGHTISKRDVMIYKDNGLTDVVNKSAEANTNAAEALEKANDGIVSTTQLWYQTNSTSAPSVPASHSQVDQGTVTYNNWRSARPNNNVDSYKYYYYCYEYLHGDGTYTYSTEAILDTSNLSQYQIDQLQTRVKKIWSNSTGSYMASGIGTNEVDIDDSSTYGFNSKSTTTGVSFNYNTISLTSLGTDGVNLYSPTLTNGVITGSRLDATLSTNGLILNKGGIKAREGYSDFIYLSTDPYGSYSINGSTGISDWKQIIGTKFGVRADGTLYANSVNIQGILTAGAGSTIGPWTVSNNAIYNPSTKSSFNSDTANGVYIGTDGIALGQGIFKVGADGVLDASGVSVSGDLVATNGFTVAQNNKTLTSITTNGMIVYDGNGTADSNIVAKFTNSGAQIGQTGNSYISLTDKYMRLYGQNWNRLTSETVPYVEFIDLRTGTTNTTTIVEKFKGTGSQVKFRLSMSVYSQIIEVKVDDLITDVTMPESDSFQFNTAPTEDSLIVATYQTSDNTAKAFTLGYRGEDSDIGGMSTVIGYNNEASSIYSYASGYYTKASAAYAHAEGNYTKATDIASHAEGSHTIASGEAAHAEGVLGEASGDAAHAEGVDTYAFGRASHAEGEGTKASGYSSHAEGWKTEASGFWYGYSHAQNEGTIAAMDAQTAIGTYNIEDEETDGYEGSTHPIKDAGDGTYGNNYGKYAFIIGNGWSGNRSNALTVDWSGNVNIASGALYHVNGVPISDFVIEQGTSGNWSYRKYNSGTYEAWYTGTNTFAIDGRFSSSSPVLYYGAIQNLSLPFAVTSIQYVDVKAIYSNWGVWTAITQADSSGIKYQSLSAVSRTSVTYAIRGYIKGTYSLT